MVPYNETNQLLLLRFILGLRSNLMGSFFQEFVEFMTKAEISHNKTRQTRYSESNFMSANKSGQIHSYYQSMFPNLSEPIC